MNRNGGYSMPESTFRFLLGIPGTLLEVAFVLNAYGRLPKVPRFPVAEVCFQAHRGGLEYPTGLGLVGTPDTHVQEEGI